MSIEPLSGNETVKTRGAARILVVEDDAQTLGTIVCILEKKGYEVLRAHNAISAISILVRKPPDLIIADIGMPIVDGLVLIREIKASADSTSIPVIAISGMDTPEYYDSAIQAGCSAFLGKPIDSEQMLGQIAELLASISAKRE